MKSKILLTCFGLIAFSFLHGSIIITNGLSHTFSVESGKNYSGKINIKNGGATFQSVELKKTDLATLSNGTYFFSDTINHIRSNRNWIIINPTEITINPDQSASINFEVHVPSDITLKGSYWSAIMVEPINLIGSAATETGIRIQTITRYAIQIICNFGNSGIGQLKFQNPGLVKEKGKPFFDFIMLNTGEHIISPIVSMELFDSETGTSVKVLKAFKKAIYPTLSKKFSFPLEGISTSKSYKAVIIADGSGEDVFGMEYTVVL